MRGATVVRTVDAAQRQFPSSHHALGLATDVID